MRPTLFILMGARRIMSEDHSAGKMVSVVFGIRGTAKHRGRVPQCPLDGAALWPSAGAKYSSLDPSQEGLS